MIRIAALVMTGKTVNNVQKEAAHTGRGAEGRDGGVLVRTT